MKISRVDDVLLKISLLILLLLIFLILETGMTKALSSDIKGQVCSNLNLSSSDCMTFWELIEKETTINQTYHENITINQTYFYNETIFINQTLNYTTIINSTKSDEMEHEYRMEELRLSHITPNISLDNYYTKSELDSKLADFKLSSVPINTVKESSFPSWGIYAIIGIAVVGGLLYRNYNKKIPTVSREQIIPTDPVLPTGGAI